MADKFFFDAVRPLFGGRLTAGQVDGMERIVAYGKANGYSLRDIAYALATAKHETANWMQPIREGARRYGPSYTDAQARRAVKAIFDKGIIRRNYALPDGPYRQSYYGRGLIQITWYDNYVKGGDLVGIDLEKTPDAALEWDVALPLLFIGMRDGMYTGKKLSDYAGFPAAMRAIVNGDVKQNGQLVSDYAVAFYTGLIGPERPKAKPIKETPACTCVCTCQGEAA